MPEIENVFSELSEGYGPELDEEEFFDVYFSFQENIGEGDGYYGGNLHAGDSLVNGDFVENELIDGAYFEDINLTSSLHLTGDSVILELHSIGINAVFYLTDIGDEVFRGGLFDPAPVNVRSNFTNLLPLELGG